MEDVAVLAPVPEAPRVEADTLLACALIPGAASRCRELLEEGADPLGRDTEGRTALHLAAWHGNLKVLEVLCGEVISVDPLDNYRVSPLLFALRSDCPGSAEAVQYLIAKGAKLTLNVAFAMGDLQLINRLYSENKKALAACKAPDELLGDLMRAIRRVCEKKAVGKGEPEARAAAEAAIMERYVPIIHRVVDQGLNPDSFGVTGRPALFDAVAFDSTVLAEALLKFGADPNFETESGDTPLRTAGEGRPEMVALLREHGAE